jgi:hypothetical protein
MWIVSTYVKYLSQFILRTLLNDWPALGVEDSDDTDGLGQLAERISSMDSNFRWTTLCHFDVMCYFLVVCVRVYNFAEK